MTQEIIFGLVDDKFRRSTQYIMRNPILFGDYRTALDEAEPRLYEDLQDYEAVKSLFQEVGMNHKLQTKRQTRAGQYGDSDSEAKGIRLSFFFFFKYHYFCGILTSITNKRHTHTIENDR